MAIYKVENGVAIAYADVALSGGGTPTPSEQTLSSIAVTTPPTKTVYDVGDMLDLSGMVVTATYSDGTTADVSRSVITNPIDGALLAFGTNQVSIRYTESGITKTTTQAIKVGKELSSISVTTPPTKVTYDAGDLLDLTGMVVTAVYDDQTTANVTSSVTTTPANHAALQGGTSSVEISYTENGITKTTTQAITVTVVDHIYGVQCRVSSDNQQTFTWYRTDDAEGLSDPVPAFNSQGGSSPFDNIMPWSGITPTQLDGIGDVVLIPKFYYSVDRDSTWTRIKISANRPSSGTYYVSPAHADRGDGKGERDYVYVGRYFCDSNNQSSSSGTKKLFTIDDPANTNTAIHGLGNTVYQWDYAMYMTIALLYFVEYAGWNTAVGIGNGVSSGNYAGQMYHTGTTAFVTGGTGSVRYRYIDALWGALNTVAGLYVDATSSGIKYYSTLDPTKFGTPTTGWDELVTSSVHSAGWINGFNFTDSSYGNGKYTHVMYPAAIVDDDVRTREFYYHLTDRHILGLGLYSNIGKAGMFTINGDIGQSTQAYTRLMVLP